MWLKTVDEKRKKTPLVSTFALIMMTFFSKLAGLDFSSGFQTGYKKGFKQSAGYNAGIIAGEAAQRKKESKSAYLAQHALSTPALNAN